MNISPGCYFYSHFFDSFSYLAVETTLLTKAERYHLHEVTALDCLCFRWCV